MMKNKTFLNLPRPLYALCASVFLFLTVACQQTGLQTESSAQNGMSTQNHAATDADTANAGSPPQNTISPKQQEYLNQLQDSLLKWKAWQQAKPNYAYESSRVSWTGFSDTRTTYVKGQAVAALTIVMRDRDGKVTTIQEAGKTLGSHPDIKKSLTVDEVYQACVNRMMQIDVEYDIVSLTFDSQGVLATCTTRHKMCADDCTQGDTIEALRVWNGVNP